MLLEMSTWKCQALLEKEEAQRKEKPRHQTVPLWASPMGFRSPLHGAYPALHHGAWDIFAML